MIPLNTNGIRSNSTSNYSCPLQESPSNMSSRIALILGSGAGVGTHVASRLRNEGFRVATVSRSSKDTQDNDKNTMAIESDLADPTTVERVFERVRGAWGEPSVVVYNGTQSRSSQQVIVAAMLMINHSVRSHQWQDPRDSSRHPDRGVRAACCRQHDIRLRCSARSPARLQDLGPRHLLLHRQLPRLEPCSQTTDFGTGQDGERTFHPSR